METIQYGELTIETEQVGYNGDEIKIRATLAGVDPRAIHKFGRILQSGEAKRLVCRGGTFDATPIEWRTTDDPRHRRGVVVTARFSVQKVSDASPYRSPAPREEEPLPRMTGKALTEMAQRYGLGRTRGEDDDALRARLKAYIVPTWLSGPLPPGFEQQVRKMQEADELRARATMYGVNLDPGETIDGLRERVDAYLAGDERAKDPRAWQEERTRRARRMDDLEAMRRGWWPQSGQTRKDADGMLTTSRDAPPGQPRREGCVGRHPNGLPCSWSCPCDACAPQDEAEMAAHEERNDAKEERRERGRQYAASLGVAMNSVPKDGIVEVQVGQPVHIGAPVARPSPEAIRAENRRVGEEIAANPPEWAYPLAWRLAVMAHVEWKNNRATPSPMQAPTDEVRIQLGIVIRRYHLARLEGLTPQAAMLQQSTEAGRVDDWTTLLCQAYERGRPGPGGVRVGRPA